MSYDGTNNLDQLDTGKPADSEERSVMGAALRETRLLLKNVLLVAHNPDGSLRVIGTAALADGAVTGDKLGDGAVNNAKLADASVGEAKYQDDSITTIKLKAGAVTEDKLANLAVGADKLKDGAVTEPKLQDNIVGESKLKDGAATTVKIADEAVTNAKLAGGINLEKLAPGTSGQIQVSDGSHWIAVTLGGDATLAANGTLTVNKAVKMASFADQKTRGTDGGNHPAGWAVRDLSEVSDNASLMTFSGNEFQLVSGKYLFFARVPAFGVGKHQARLFADLGSSNAILLWGSSAVAPLTMQSDSIIQGYIDVDSAWTLRIEHWVETPAAGTDLGQSASSDNSTPYSNHKEVYTEGWLVKVG